VIVYYIPPVADGETVRAKARKEARETGQVITVHNHPKGHRCNTRCEALYDGPDEDVLPELRRSCRRCR
jgi:hypothetical protein